MLLGHRRLLDLSTSAHPYIQPCQWSSSSGWGSDQEKETGAGPDLESYATVPEDRTYVLCQVVYKHLQTHLWNAGQRNKISGRAIVNPGQNIFK